MNIERWLLYKVCFPFLLNRSIIHRDLIQYWVTGHQVNLKQLVTREQEIVILLGSFNSYYFLLPKHRVAV